MATQMNAAAGVAFADPTAAAATMRSSIAGSKVILTCDAPTMDEASPAMISVKVRPGELSPFLLNNTSKFGLTANNAAAVSHKKTTPGLPAGTTSKSKVVTPQLRQHRDTMKARTCMPPTTTIAIREGMKGQFKYENKWHNVVIKRCHPPSPHNNDAGRDKLSSSDMATAFDVAYLDYKGRRTNYETDHVHVDELRCLDCGSMGDGNGGSGGDRAGGAVGGGKTKKRNTCSPRSSRRVYVGMPSQCRDPLAASSIEGIDYSYSSGCVTNLLGDEKGSDDDDEIEFTFDATSSTRCGQRTIRATVSDLLFISVEKSSSHLLASPSCKQSEETNGGEQAADQPSYAAGIARAKKSKVICVSDATDCPAVKVCPRNLMVDKFTSSDKAGSTSVSRGNVSRIARAKKSKVICVSDAADCPGAKIRSASVDESANATGAAASSLSESTLGISLNKSISYYDVCHRYNCNNRAERYSRRVERMVRAGIRKENSTANSHPQHALLQDNTQDAVLSIEKNHAPVATEDSTRTDHSKNNREFEASFSKRKLGITLVVRPPGSPTLVGAVDTSSEAAELGVRVGDELVKVNGASIEDMSFGAIVRLISDVPRPTNLIFRRCEDHEASANVSRRLRSVAKHAPYRQRKVHVSAYLGNRAFDPSRSAVIPATARRYDRFGASLKDHELDRKRSASIGGNPNTSEDSTISRQNSSTETRDAKSGFASVKRTAAISPQIVNSEASKAPYSVEDIPAYLSRKRKAGNQVQPGDNQGTGQKRPRQVAAQVQQPDHCGNANESACSHNPLQADVADAKEGAMSSASELQASDDGDPLLSCPICLELFDFDPSKVKDKRQSNLPVHSSACTHKVCCSCLIGWQAFEMSKFASSTTRRAPKWMKCPSCKGKTAFNAVNLPVDVFACECIRKMSITAATKDAALANAQKEVEEAKKLFAGCIQARENEKTQLIDQIEALKAAAEQAKNEAVEYKRQADEARQSNVATTKDLQSKFGSLKKQAGASINAVRDELRATKSELESKVRFAENDKAQLVKKCQRLEAKVSSKSTELAIAKRRLDTLEANKSQQSQMLEISATINRLQVSGGGRSIKYTIYNTIADDARKLKLDR